MAEKKSLVPVVAKELRPHAIWALIVWVGSLAGSAMIAALVALWQKLRHVSLDWFFIGGLFSLSFVVLVLLLYLAKKLSREHSKQHDLIIGLTTDNVELEPAPKGSSAYYKFKLRVYWTNDGERIHIGKPGWIPLGVGIQDNVLGYRFQVLQDNGQWGPETAESDVLPSQRCRIYLGLDPTLCEVAEHLLEEGRLGTLVLPVNSGDRTIELRIRPRKSLRVKLINGGVPMHPISNPISKEQPDVSGPKREIHLRVGQPVNIPIATMKDLKAGTVLPFEFHVHGPTLGLKEKALITASSILNFVVGREKGAPPYPSSDDAAIWSGEQAILMAYDAKTLTLFRDGVGKEAVTLHDELLKRGFQDPALDRLYNDPGTTSGIKVIGQKLRDLAEKLPPDEQLQTKQLS